MMLLKAVPSLLLVAFLGVPSHGSDLLNGVTNGKDDFCVDIDQILNPSGEDAGEAPQDRNSNEATCDTGNIFNNRLDISVLGTLVPELLNGIEFSMVLGSQCFALTLVQGTTANSTLLEIENGSCLDVLAAFTTAIAPGEAKELCLGNSCSTPSRRNLLHDAITLHKEDAVYHEYSKKCAKYEYDVSLYVDTHMVAVASPRQDAIAAGCPLVATHSKYDHQANKYEKEVFGWMNNHHEVDRAFNRDSYSIGAFKGTDLIQAHESIDLAQHRQQEYDIVSNNCASFMIALAKALNVKIDTKMTAFVARRLIASSSKDFVDKIRNSVNFKSLFNGRNLRVAEKDMTEKSLIDLLVEKNSVGLI